MLLTSCPRAWGLPSATKINVAVKTEMPLYAVLCAVSLPPLSSTKKASGWNLGKVILLSVYLV